MPRGIRQIWVTAVFVAAYFACWTTPSQANAVEALAQLETQLVNLYQRNKDAIVRVKVATKSMDENGEEQVSLTVLSGFFIDKEGVVLTNAIPSSKNNRIWIERNGSQLLAVVLGVDQKANIGLIKVAKPPDQLTFIDLKAPATEPAIGSIAFTITSPLDFSPTPKWGLVSGKESHFSDIDFPFTYTRISIQTGPAEGGSPVFDRRGQLMGISVATLPEIDSSYIVPTRSLQRIASSLGDSGAFAHPTIHVKFEEQSLPFANETRIAISEIEPGSPAAASGLQEGDTVLRIGEQAATSLNHVRDQIFYSEIGSFLPLTIQRGDKELEFAVLLEGVE